jgi:hypothetical protein
MRVKVLGQVEQFTVPNGVPKLPNEVTLDDFWFWTAIEIFGVMWRAVAVENSQSAVGSSSDR